MRIGVELPMPPSVNRAYRNIPGKGRALSKEAKSWKDAARESIKVAASMRNIRKKTDDLITMTITAHADWFTKSGKPKKRDLSNLKKLAEDAVASVLFSYGDEQVFTSVMHKKPSKDGKEKILITVEKMEE